MTSQTITTKTGLEITIARRTAGTPATVFGASTLRTVYVPTWQDCEGAAYETEAEAVAAATVIAAAMEGY